MAKQDPIARSLAIVDKALRAAFPDDFDKRCMYAAFGLRSLLQEAGLSPEIVGGEFLCLALSPDGKRATLQGFGKPNSQEPSHYWVELGKTLIDVGPHYLPRNSSHPSVPIPFVRWSLAAPLPRFLRYRAVIRYDPHVTLVSDAEILNRMDDFLARCQQENQAATGEVKLPTWQLKDMASLQYAAQRGDPWARGTSMFLRHSATIQLPF
jgi:hypothetical protein